MHNKKENFHRQIMQQINVRFKIAPVSYTVVRFDSFNKISKTTWALRVPRVSVAFRLYCKVPHITLYSFSGTGCRGSTPGNEIMTILYSQITGKRGLIAYATGFFVVCLKIHV